jgi:hypothetical protein
VHPIKGARQSGRDRVVMRWVVAGMTVVEVGVGGSDEGGKVPYL